jgi:hypothetical protein
MARILPVSRDERLAICSVNVTLDGHPATISGVQNNFATVADMHGHSVEFAWTTAAHIVVRGGRFYS